jgi:hypothetical protein
MDEPAKLSPQLGPVLMGTLLCRDLEQIVHAYTTFMHAHVHERGTVDAGQAKLWKMPELEGHAFAVLANAKGRPWLRILEDPDCTDKDSLKHTGWMALEILVQNVDELAEELKTSPFEILRPVANLDVSDDIRAVQVRGPCGEILYLTQIKGPVPPFELPRASCPVDHIFIPILCSHDRDKSLEFYSALSKNSGLKFDTKITVLNQAYGYDLERKHQVATLQLRDNTLIEIDQIDAAQTPKSGSISGILMLSFAHDQNRVLQGPSGEWVELVKAHE